jgi:hypothetical protein
MEVGCPILEHARGADAVYARRSMLNKFVAVNRDEIIARCEAKATTRSRRTSAREEPNHGVSMFVDQLVDALAGVSVNAVIENTATQHGADLLLQGFTVSQVV